MRVGAARELLCKHPWSWHGAASLWVPGAPVVDLLFSVTGGLMK